MFCKVLARRKLNELLEVLKSCIMDSIKIDSSEFTIGSAKDETVEEIYFDHNPNLSFLPKAIGEKFPNLLSLSAWDCSLIIVSKDNFINLSSVRRMALNENQITTISAETFKDLQSLEWLFLDHNRIKSLNAEVFESLPRLKLLSLVSNKCVDKDFSGELEMAEMPQVLTEKCKNENDNVNDNHFQSK